jgi:prepilin-type N-terminal cleavage/methylation domain-containing protein
MGSFRRLRTRATGFTLIEVVVVMLIFAVVIAMASVITRGIVAAQKRSLTATRVAAIETALAQFVQQQKRLPCPANGTLVSSANNAGVEARAGGACTGNQQDGVVPWRTLGLTETDATDAWDRRLTYRVGAALVADNGMDMSQCDPAGSEPPTAPAAGRACTSPCVGTNLLGCTPPSAFLPQKGLEVRDIAGNVTMNPAGVPHTGAAYVVISHGESGGGGYFNTGILATSTVGDGTEEQKNYASLPYAGVATYYVDNALIETADTTHFDDIVLRPSVLAVINKAGLGPRAH